MPALCQMTGSEGDAWEATCGTQKIGGGDRSEVAPFTLADGRVCTGAIEDGSLRGQCTGGDAGSCTFESKSELLPTPYCLELPSTLTNVDVCGAAPAGAQALKATQCAVVQDECRFQARCEGGAVFSGNVTPTGLRWDLTPTYRCVGTLEGGNLTGTCTERNVPADAGAPKTCSLSAQGEQPSQDCEQDLPKGGFVLEGCGSEGTLCTVAQRGCIWQASCGGQVYRARVNKPGSYEFTLATGARCTAQVRDGVFSGSCGEGTDACAIHGTDPVAPTGCLGLPSSGSNARLWRRHELRLAAERLRRQAACATANGTFVTAERRRKAACSSTVRTTSVLGSAKKPAASAWSWLHRLGGTGQRVSPRIEGGPLVLTAALSLVALKPRRSARASGRRHHQSARPCCARADCPPRSRRSDGSVGEAALDTCGETCRSVASVADGASTAIPMSTSGRPSRTGCNTAKPISAPVCSNSVMRPRSITLRNRSGCVKTC